MVSTDHFRQGLLAQMDRASHGGLIDVLINSGDCIAHLVAIRALRMGCRFAATPWKRK
jgi:hypothetical protein